MTSPWSVFPWFLLRGTGMPLSWLDPLATLPHGEPVDAATWAEALTASRRALAALFQRPLVRHALFLSNPDLDAHLDGWLESLSAGPRNAKSRARERTLSSYASRFCAKNETASFYGAASLGRFDRPRADGATPSPPTSPSIDEATLPIEGSRRVFLEQWMAEARLAAAAAELGAPAGWGALPQGTRDVVAAAQAKLATLPESEARARWRRRLSWLTEALAGFAAADLDARRPLLAELEGRLSRWSRIPARRHPGGWYASRTAIHEKVDRAGRTVAAPEAWGEALRSALGPWLDLSALPWIVERMTFRAWAAEAFPSDDWRPWSEVLAAHDRAGLRYHLAMPPEARALKAELSALRDHLRTQIDAHLERHGAGAPLRLDPAPLAQLVPSAAAALAADGATFCSPDVMLARRPSGRLEVVLGEAHEHAVLEPWLYAAAPEIEALFADERAHLRRLAAPAEPALVWKRREAFTAWTGELGEIALELDARAQAPAGRRHPFEALEVSVSVEGLRFRVEGREVMPLSFGRRTRLGARVWPLTLIDPASWLTGRGWRAPHELPRLSWGELVVHRRRWRLPSSAWAEGAEPWEARARVLGRFGPELPRFCFSREPGHRKPLVVDWDDPCSVELLHRLARRHPSLELSEMLPGPEALWLRGPDGLHTSELRTLFFRGAGEPSSA